MKFKYFQKMCVLSLELICKYLTFATAHQDKRPSLVYDNTMDMMRCVTFARL